jgi:serine/threonine protein kinase
MAELLASDPTTIGPYRLLERIGTGGMGVVYLVAGPDGSQAALKLIRSELADDPAFRARFRREVEAGRRVGGVCNAKYLDADLDAERPYLVTEYVPGGNLADYVAANGPLPGDQAVSLAVGLVAMSSVGVIHRDLKPSNVLMGTSGPKVVDFGIVHAADGTALTQTGVMVGSPSWMAPEQATGQSGAAATDVFSWGATVAFASTGRSPFGEGRPDAVLYRVVHEPPDLEGLDPRLDGIVRQALEKDPARRPTPDDLLLGLIRTAVAGVMPSGDADAMTTAVLDRTWHQGTAIAPTNSTLVGTGPGGSEDEPAGRGKLWWLAVIGFVVVAALIAGGIALASKSNNKQASSTAANSSAANSTGAKKVKSVVTTTTVASVAATTPSTSASGAATVSAQLSQVVCPTTYGNQPTNTPSLPSTVAKSVPSSLVNQIAVYTDAQGQMQILAPTGWSCFATLGADGSSTLAAFPQGQPNPTDSGTSADTGEQVVGSQTGACVGCLYSQVTPLFSAAASQCAVDYAGVPSQCPGPYSGESIDPIGNGIVGFLDPPGVKGSGAGSGGAYPANGVATYQGVTGSTPSYIETCTLPDSQHSLCTAALDDFVLAYGSQ